MKSIIKQRKNANTPVVKINKELDKFADKVLFPEKLAEANEILKRTGPIKFKIR